jgi:hypothetical protein
VTPLGLAGIWVAAGIAAVLLLPPLRRRRLAWAAPALAGLAGLATTSVGSWPGPAGSPAFGASVALGRPGLGLLVAAGIALAGTMALAPRLDGGEVLPACVAAAAVTVAMAATVAVVWSLGVAVAIGAVTVRWIAVAPGRSTLAAGRVAGLGAAALLGGATFLPVAGAAVDARTALTGALLAGGVAAIVALVPLGGWAAAAVGAVRGADLAPWALLVAPSLLLSVGVLLPGLPAPARSPFANVLLVLGLASALFGGAQALTGSASTRYGRLLIADLALAAAALGSGHQPGRLGGWVLILAHLCAAPLLLHPPRGGTVRQRQLTWLALSGLPPSPAFWGRFLVLEALAATSGVALTAGLLAGTGLVAAAVRSLVEPPPPEAEAPAATPGLQALAWAAAFAAVAVGFAPAAIAARIFGGA